MCINSLWDVIELEFWTCRAMHSIIFLHHVNRVLINPSACWIFWPFQAMMTSLPFFFFLSFFFFLHYFFLSSLCFFLYPFFLFLFLFLPFFLSFFVSFFLSIFPLFLPFLSLSFPSDKLPSLPRSGAPRSSIMCMSGRDMKFGMESQWGNTFWAIGGFFQFPPLSRDMGVGWCSPWGLKNLKFFFFQFFPIFELHWLNPVYIIVNIQKFLNYSQNLKSYALLNVRTKYFKNIKNTNKIT